MNGWRTISRGLALMTTFAAGLAAAGAAPMLVEYLAMAEVDASRFSTEQAATLETIHSDPAAIDIRVGPAYPDAVRNARALSLVVPAPSGADTGTTVSFDGLRVDQRAEQDYSLYYRDETSGSEVALVLVQGLDVLGTIRHDGEVYRMHPLGGGLTAVYRYDTSLLPLQGGEYEAAPENQRLYRAASRHSGAATGHGEAIIDVLVAYTPHARAHAGNIDAFIQFMFDQTNQIYANSLIRPRVRLVHSYQTEYMQTDDVLTDLFRLQAPADTFMDEVHARRDDYGADVVALLVGHRSNDCGTAWIHARAEYAFYGDRAELYRPLRLCGKAWSPSRRTAQFGSSRQQLLSLRLWSLQRPWQLADRNVLESGASLPRPHTALLQSRRFVQGNPYR